MCYRFTEGVHVCDWIWKKVTIIFVSLIVVLRMRILCTVWYNVCAVTLCSHADLVDKAAAVVVVVPVPVLLKRTMVSVNRPFSTDHMQTILRNTLLGVHGLVRLLSCNCMYDVC